MRSLLIALVASLTILVASLTILPPAHAITFDLWQTGMARQEIFNLAQRQNLPLARDGLFHRDKGYNPKLLVGDTTCYYYQTILLDHQARVRLYLSPAKGQYGQFLYEIEVTFTDVRKNRDLLPYVKRMLEEKYGPGRLGNSLVPKSWVWRPEAEGEIRLIFTGATLQIKYTDLKIRKFADELSKSTYELPKDPGRHRDAGKF